MAQSKPADSRRTELVLKADWMAQSAFGQVLAGPSQLTGGTGMNHFTSFDEHAVVIAGGGPTGLMLAGELALAGVDVAIVERRESHDLAGLRAGGLHIRTIEVLDQRGIAERFVSQGQVFRSAPFAGSILDISGLP